MIKIHALGHRAASRRGMTLIEIIVAVAIIAVLATAAVPVTTKMLTYKARKATREELQVLADGALNVFGDTGVIPSSVTDLLVDTGDAGWSGPYLAGVVTDHISGTSGYEVDAWSRSYDYSVSGDSLTILSLGEDATQGSTDDLLVVAHVTVVRREHTVSELKVLNQSILAYNSLYMVSAPLPTHWPSAYSTLVSQGFLPSHNGYLTDGWNQTYVAVGTGGPLVELTSSAL
jgi:prepilin-type N-terminal cleavage/methylation domain-containing protein